MFLCPLIIFVVVGTLSAREPDIDINRIQLVPTERFGSESINSHERRSVSDSYQARSNDYDDHSIGHNGFRSPPPFFLREPSTKAKNSKSPIKVHRPREDPRLFYQSDSYLKENYGKNINNEVSFIYPGREVVGKSLPIRAKEHYNTNDGSNICVRCPHDRTLIAKFGSDRVLLQKPHLLTCAGHKAPKNVHLSHMYGPKFGTLLEQGSHMIVGRILYINKYINLCKMQVHVVIQGCATPSYLESSCRDNNKTCEFTCRDHRLELRGPSSLKCGTDSKWIGELPRCVARSWCEHPPIPENGRLSCKGTTMGGNSGLADGSKCRVRCARGWRWYPRAVTVCRRGSWTNSLSCQKTNKYRNI